MRRTILSLISFTLAGSQHLLGEPLHQNSSPKSEPNQITSLPAHIKASPAQLSLVADFEHKEDGKVGLYLINDTDADIPLASQDGDIGCKRESKAANGKWMRCDTHRYSWCGNSYGRRMLKAGHFLAWEQVCDTQTGQIRPLHFKLYGQGDLIIVSNEGNGMVDESDMQFCRFDSLAMRHGPFEDIAAVATGKVPGGQGASADGRSEAIRALDRFSSDKRLFPLVQEIVRDLVASHSAKSNDQAHIYAQCLAPLEKAVGSSLSREELWSYVNDHLHNESFPWRGEALNYLVRAFEWEKNKLRPVVEEVLSTNGHPAFRSAIFSYSKVVEKQEAGIRLAAIENNKDRSESDRDTAQSAREALFPNPYLSIKAEAGERSAHSELAPLKKVTITNISPQSITLPVARPEALLVIQLSEYTDQGAQHKKQFSIDEQKGTLVMEAGQQVVIHDVKWWQALRGQTFKPDSHYNVQFLARSPSLWSIPTQPCWGWAPKGDELLKALEDSKATGK